MHICNLNRVLLPIAFLMTFFVTGAQAQTSVKSFSAVEGFIVEFDPGPPPLVVSCRTLLSERLAKNGLSFTWTFEEGAQSRGQNASHMYLTPGQHRVSLVIQDQHGNSLEFEKTIQVGEEEEEMPALAPVTGYRPIPIEKNLLGHPTLIPRRNAFLVNK